MGLSRERVNCGNFWFWNSGNVFSTAFDAFAARANKLLRRDAPKDARLHTSWRETHRAGGLPVCKTW